MKDEVLPHWTLVAWGIIIPLGISLGLMQKGWEKRHLKWHVIASGAVLIFSMAELTFQFIKFPSYQSPYADLTGWPSLHSDIKSIVTHEKPGRFAIAVPNWTLGSRARYYLSDIAPVFVLDDHFDQFDLWEENQGKVPDLLVLNWRGFELNP